jgi:hypothetical protein
MAVAFSTDAARLVSASMDRTAAVWDRPPARSPRTSSATGRDFAARFVTPTRVVTASYDRTARL